MAKLKKFTADLSVSDFLDVKLKTEKNKVVEFSLNYRAMIGERYYEVYRIDMAHGYLHEQRYWISPEPIPLDAPSSDLNFNVTFFMSEIKKNFERYKRYFLQKGGFKYEV